MDLGDDEIDENRQRNTWITITVRQRRQLKTFISLLHLEPKQRGKYWEGPTTAATTTETMQSWKRSIPRQRREWKSAQRFKNSVKVDADELTMIQTCCWFRKAVCFEEKYCKRWRGGQVQFLFGWWTIKTPLSIDRDRSLREGGGGGPNEQCPRLLKELEKFPESTNASFTSKYPEKAQTVFDKQPQAVRCRINAY